MEREEDWGSGTKKVAIEAERDRNREKGGELERVAER